MNLLELKYYLQKVRVVSLFNICMHFNSTPDLAKAQLAHWIRKGKVRPCTKAKHCGTKCSKCLPALTQMYEWCESEVITT